MTTEQSLLGEQDKLDQALQNSDQFVARMLKEDDRRQRRRRWVFGTLLVLGGFAMGTIFVGLVSSWFAVAAVTAEDTQHASQLMREGWQLWQQQNLADAEAKFAESVKLNPKNPDAWNGLGWSRFNQGERKTAIEAFEECIKLSPKHPAALNGLGQAYFFAKDYKNAERYLTKAAPQAPAAWYGLAKLYLLTGDFKKALPYAKKIAAADPNDDGAAKMLEAAQSGKLGDELKSLIEPEGEPAADDDPADKPAN